MSKKGGSSGGAGPSEEQYQQLIDAATGQTELSSEVAMMALEPALAQMDMGQEWWNQTAPIRSGVTSRLTDFLQGNFDPTASALYAPSKMAIEDQYGVARENLVSALPSGGGMYDAMAALEGNRARSLADTVANIAGDEYSKAYGVATSSPQMSMSGMAGATSGLTGASSAVANAFSPLASAFGQYGNYGIAQDQLNASASAGIWGGLGQGLGYLGGSLLGGGKGSGGKGGSDFGGIGGAVSDTVGSIGGK